MILLPKKKKGNIFSPARKQPIEKREIKKKGKKKEKEKEAFVWKSQPCLCCALLKIFNTVGLSLDKSKELC